MFKVGDHIIAIKDFRYPGGCIDRSYKGHVSQVLAVTPEHYVLKTEYSPKGHIISVKEFEERTFIIADPKIIPPYNENPEILPQKKILKTVECWVNFYPNYSYSYSHKTKEEADEKTQGGRIGGKAFHFVGQYME